MTGNGPLRRRGAAGDDPARAPRRSVDGSWGRRYPHAPTSRRSRHSGQSQPDTEIFRRIAAVMGVGHPALPGLRRTALLATYLEGYDAADVDHLWERGWVKIRPEEDPRPKALLRSEAILRLGAGRGSGRSRRAARRRPARRPDPQIPPFPQLHRRQPRRLRSHGRRAERAARRGRRHSPGRSGRRLVELEQYHRHHDGHPSASTAGGVLAGTPRSSSATGGGQGLSRAAEGPTHSPTRRSPTWAGRPASRCASHVTPVRAPAVPDSSAS